MGFNTASGKYCCNMKVSIAQAIGIIMVSIPQAVSTVATSISVTNDSCQSIVSIPQAVSTVATNEQT